MPDTPSHDDDLTTRVDRLEHIVEAVDALRAALSTIADAIDPALTQRVADLEATVANHGLLLGRLLDR
jgi:hypothetical protein